LLRVSLTPKSQPAAPKNQVHNPNRLTGTKINRKFFKQFKKNAGLFKTAGGKFPNMNVLGRNKEGLNLGKDEQKWPKYYYLTRN
jgi:hypothetical protein